MTSQKASGQIAFLYFYKRKGGLVLSVMPTGEQDLRISYVNCLSESMEPIKTFLTISWNRFFMKL